MRTPKLSSEARKAPSIEEDEMILHYYGESADREAIDRALAEDAELRARYERLRGELDRLPKLELPEADADLAARVWSGIRPELEPYRPFGRIFDRLRDEWRFRPGFALAAAATLALAAGILIGRGSQETVPPAVAEAPALSEGARERLLLASVGDHLDGSARLLTTIANSSDAATLGEKRDWAASLAVTNRLYRAAAERSGQRKIVALLDELEPLLLELANAPAESPDSIEELSATKERIDQKDLLFKLRVTGDRLERSVRDASRSRTPTATS
jgi:hypothetical protein